MTESISQIFERQKTHQYALAKESIDQRISKLKALKKAILAHKEVIRSSLQKDYRKPTIETDLTEIFVVIKEIDYACKHLYYWTKYRKVNTPISLFGGQSYIYPEPKGVSLIISPWNYPIQLSLGPLVSAVAAGCPVIIKPSEYNPYGVVALRQIVTSVFDIQEVAIVEGEVDVATALLELPFNHIFFTGSPAVGKIVMEAAAKNLSSVTLELGGKSPAIVHKDAALAKIIPRIVWGKFSNCGQTCIAPDYVLVHQDIIDEFAARLIQEIKQVYGDNAADSPDYMRIIDDRHLKRLQNMLSKSVEQGADIIYGGLTSSTEKGYLDPTVVLHAPLNTQVMREEIFGPILPIIPYSTDAEVIHLIRQHEKPLALYIYSRSRSFQKNIVHNTRAGTTVINHNNIHFGNPRLPFGGSNHSGLGKSHGYFGFLAFTNERAVFKQVGISPVDFLRPPYSAWKQRLVDWTLRWF